MKIDLGKIITRAWQIIWNHKVLWIFGILAGFANGGGGSGNSSNYSSDSSTPSPFSDGQTEQFTRQAGEFLQQYMLIIIAACIVILLLSFAFYALGMMGRIGILKGVYKVEQGASSLMFGELWSESMPYFWRFFGLNFLVGLAFFAILIPFFILGIATMGIGLICLVPLICLLVPIGWVVSVILEQAQAAIVAEDLGIVESFRRGWEIVKSDIGGMIVLALALGIGGAIIGLILALPIFAAMLPVVFSLVSYDVTSMASVPPTVWVSLACCAVYFPILLALSGVVTAYIKTAWALSYLQLTAPKAEAPVFAEGNA